MKRYTPTIAFVGVGQVDAHMDETKHGKYVLYSDQEAAVREAEIATWAKAGAEHNKAIREAVAKRDDEWATAIAKYAAYSQCKAIADEMSAREST